MLELSLSIGNTIQSVFQKGNYKRKLEFKLFHRFLEYIFPIIVPVNMVQFVGHINLQISDTYLSITMGGY